MNKSDFVWVVFYTSGTEKDFNYLAAFKTKAQATEYKNRSVWSHLDTYVSRQPVF